MKSDLGKARGTGGHSRQSNEDRLIARYFKPLAHDPGALSLEDDAAVVRLSPKDEMVVTADAVIAGVHFFADDPPFDVARKALRVNLSDLAAKGAHPRGFLLTLALPAGISRRWLSDFARGLGADAAEFDCPLLGGDTVQTGGPIAISITAFGSLPKRRMIRRRGAKAGHCIVVTGTVGDAALGLLLRRSPRLARLWALSARQTHHLASRYRLPQPRNVLAAAIRTCASAAMDVSDGLAGDLAKLCRASGVTAEIRIDRLPLSNAARKVLASHPSLIKTILSGGDDYEIVAAVPPAKLPLLRRLAAASSVPIAEIGMAVRGTADPRFLDRAGNPIRLERLSFSHF